MALVHCAQMANREVATRSRGKTAQKPTSSGRSGHSGRSSRSGLRRALGVVVGITVLGGLLAVGAVFALFTYYGSDSSLPSIESLENYRPKQVTRISDRRGVVIGELGSEKRTFVPYAQIPMNLVNAVVSAEDADYWNHAGLDYRGVLRAFVENVLRGRTAQGGSTITQQVVKTFLLSPERTVRRKVQEIILARRLSQKLSKEKVLELYLNQINYGHGRYGCEEAARFYFGKSVADTDLAEDALLAGLPQSPERLSPRKHPDAAKNRQRYVLGQMVARGYLERAVADRVAAAPIRLSRDVSASAHQAPEAVDLVSRFLAERAAAATANASAPSGATAEPALNVETSIDARLQGMARQALERGLEEVDARQGFRGAVGHVVGKALIAHRAALAALRKSKSPPQIYEGIVAATEADPRDPRLGKLRFDLGDGVLGVVDLSQEPRYTRTGKPLLEKLSPGDLVRVRIAPERAGASSHPGSPPGEPPLSLALEMGPQAAMVVMEPHGHEVLALVGGYDFHAAGFDRSQRAWRLPGSAFKPVLYAAAIESRRFTAASVLNDAPDVYDRWKPQNYEKEEFRGPVRLRTALAHSINTVAIKLLEQVGIPATRDMAARVGITATIPEDVGLSLALGTFAIHPMELASAYATFADGGARAPPRLVLAVGGKAIEYAAPVAAVAPDVAFVMVSMMRSVVQEGTASSAAARLRRPIAGKTGTSNALRDAWFVGFTPDLLAAVWVGFDDQRKLGHGEAGAKTALPIWIDFMSQALAGQPVRDFAQPPGVVVQRIDKATGLLPAPGKESGPDSIDEVFLEGTVPTEVAPAAGHEQSADELLLEQ
jgi:penicillin-binding protein 1A